MEQYLPWIILVSHVLILLFIDFFVLHKKNSVISSKKALKETLFFVTNAALFAGVVYWVYDSGLRESVNNLPPSDSVVKYLTGYIIELSLSVDNLFVIAVIFVNYKIPQQYQHRLLFLGILGALIFRAVLISFGLLLVDAIHSITIFFGLFLLFTALKMLKKDNEDGETKPSRINALFNISDIIDEGKFRTLHEGKRVWTALFGALLTIEFTDLLFALDSIPAVFAITTDAFLVFSSNIFAIMGLRSLYFFLADLLEKFSYIKYSVFAILIFVSLKLMTAMWLEIPEWFSLAFIGLALGIGIYVSVVKGEEEKV